MKARELMIGDWVYSTFCDKPCKVIGIEQYESEYVNVKVTNVTGAKDINSLYFIPLTAEILEKNGFVEEAYGWRKLNAANWCININIFNGKERYALCVLGTNAQVTLHGYYVHELQHALRLCGIDKTIEL